MAVTVNDYLADWPPPGKGEQMRTLPEAFAEAADMAGDVPAVFADGRLRRWPEWRAEAQALARGLQELGVQPGDVVAVQLPNSWPFLVAHVAIADIGAVMLPLHMALGPSEQRSLLRRSGARLLIVPGTDAGGQVAGGRIPPSDELPALVHVLTADVPRQALPAAVLGSGARVAGSVTELCARWQGSRPRPVTLTPDMPFVLLPSSGTTSARPKICLHTHGGLLGNAAIVAADGEARGTDVLVSASPFTHLFGLLSIHLSILVRGTQALLPSWDAAACLDLVRSSQASVLFAVPAQLRDVVARLGAGDAAGRIRLREIRTGGAAVPGALAADLDRLTGARTVVQWGMSEVGAGTYTRPADPLGAAARSIGRPVTGSEARVVDDQGVSCPPGQTGQLQFRGPHLFRGYLGDPELTRAALTPDGWLMTGDRAGWNADGTIAFEGRDAEIISVGGQKFSASEVEGLLSELPQLGMIAMTGRPDARLGEYPCLLVTLLPGATISLAEISAHLERRGVARYKWPLELIVAEELPVTPTRKIARGRLAEFLTRRGQRAAEGGPAVPWAEQLAGLPDPARLRTALELVRATAAGLANAADPDGTFRDAGIDSAGAIRLSAMLSAATGLDLATTVAFDYPTLDALARHLVAEAAQASGSAPAAGRAAPMDAAPMDAAPMDGAGDTDAIAIIGIGCCFPGGVRSPEEFWAVLAENRDLTSEFPVDRGWDLGRLYDPDPGRPGKTYVRRGGFVADAVAFDAQFFGISPREAADMDPQQRLLLETSWEALERAGIDPLALRGSDAGVFVGLMGSDYAPRVNEAPESFDGYRVTGNAASVACGRIAYVLGLTGPALTVDTACSSSLVALHLAAQSLRQGECSLALAGGVTVMATAASFVEFSRQRAMAPDGRCKPFAAAADGSAWSEGAGMLVLERVGDARRQGHPVLAVIRGSAVNSDGASNGLTAPNGLSQQRVIRQALAGARLGAGQVDVVEAHGTGTVLGDPIEASALLATYGQDRAGAPLWLGSVKSNIGHAQAAAGVAGVIKIVLALRHETLPATLHVDAPSPHVDWASGAVRLLQKAQPWPRGGRPRAAGVSAFGIGGTNAHLILQDAPPQRADADLGRALPAGPARGQWVPWVLSAKDGTALRQMAARLSHAVSAAGDVDPVDIGQALVRSRSSFGHRAVVVGRHRQDFLDGLAAVAAEEPAAGVVTGRAQRPGKTAFVFPGQGSQWPGMGMALLAGVPEFAESIAACERALTPHVDWSLLGVLRGDPGQPPLDRVDVSQAALFAVMVSLAAAWRAVGVHPDVVIGHSQGEIAAAHVAGALSLEDAAAVVARRAKAVRELPHGAMAVIAAAPGELPGLLARWGSRLSVAAVNAPTSLVVAGASDDVAELVADLVARGVRATTIPVDYASHSPQVAGIRERLEEALATISPRSGQVPLYSTVDSGWLDTATMTSAYWYRNLRQPVQFAPAIGRLLDAGYRNFIEVSPHPVLTYAVQETADAAAVTVCAVGSLHRDDGGPQRFLLSAAEAYAHGVPVDWTALFAGRPAHHVDLPTYPFQRQAYRAPTTSAMDPQLAPAAPADPGRSAESADGAVMRRELVARPGAEGRQAALDLVREQAAAVAHFTAASAVPAAGQFHQLGFDSLASVELGQRLATALGMRLPASVVFDHATPEGLAGYLQDRLTSTGEPDETAAGGPGRTGVLPGQPRPGQPAAQDTRPAAQEGGAWTAQVAAAIVAIFSAASAAGQEAVSLEILKDASMLRPAFGSEPSERRPVAAVRLSEGPVMPTLVCFPSVMPMGGPHEYSALARRLEASRAVLALPEPGFVAGEKLPASLEALVAAQAEAVLGCGSAPTVLCGHSSGGLIAHAVAARLEALGQRPVGLVLIDTYWPDPDFPADILPQIVRIAASPGRLVSARQAGPERLTAMGGYLRILADWQPSAIGTPTLFLRAREPLPGLGKGGSTPPWKLPHTVAEIPGDHFSAIAAHAGAAVAAIESWLARTEGVSS